MCTLILLATLAAVVALARRPASCVKIGGASSGIAINVQRARQRSSGQGQGRALVVSGEVELPA